MLLLREAVDSSPKPHLVKSICDSYLNRLKTDECGFSNEDNLFSCSLIVEQLPRLLLPPIYTTAA